MMLSVPQKKKDGQQSHQPMTATKRLLAGLRDGKMADIELVGDDGVHVPALRCVLACASPVMHKLLYGDPNKAAAPVVKIDGCSNKTLRALVEYCCSDELNASIWDGNCSPSEIVKDIVALAKVAHAYAIPNMEERVLEGINPLMSAIPPLACVVFNFADPTTSGSIYMSALSAIHERPYICLQQDGQSVGGIVSLYPEKVKEILKDTSLQVDELFLFKALLRWRAFNQDNYTNVNAICKQLVGYIKLADMDPSDLKSTVLESDLVDERTLIDALLEQSIAATRAGLAFATLRGKTVGEQVQVMVQGAGSSECNGLYKQIQREGTMLCYSKRINEKRSMLLFKDSHVSWKLCDQHHIYYEWKGSHEEHCDQFPVSGWEATTHTTGDMPAPSIKWFRPRGKSSRIPLNNTEASPSSSASSVSLPAHHIPPYEPRHSPGEQGLPSSHSHHQHRYRHFNAPRTPIPSSSSSSSSSDTHGMIRKSNTSDMHGMIRKSNTMDIRKSASSGAPHTPVAVRVSPRTPSSPASPSPLMSFAQAALPSLKESVTWKM